MGHSHVMLVHIIFCLIAGNMRTRGSRSVTFPTFRLEYVTISIGSSWKGQAQSCLKLGNVTNLVAILWHSLLSDLFCRKINVTLQSCQYDHMVRLNHGFTSCRVGQLKTQNLRSLQKNSVFGLSYKQGHSHIGSIILFSFSVTPLHPRLIY